MAVDINLLKNEILAQYGTPQGPNCAECMYLYAVKALNIDAPDGFMRIATPFGGGIGRCEDACGTLIGGVMIIGLKYGRHDLSGDKFRSYGVVKEFYHWFKNEFGATNCHDLNFGDFTSDEHKNRCGGTYITESIRFLDSLFDKVDSGEWQHSE